MQSTATEQNTEGAGSVGGISMRAMHAQNVAGDEGGETTESEIEEGEEENGTRPHASVNDTNTDEQYLSRPAEVRKGAAAGGGKGGGGRDDDCPRNPNAGTNAQSLPPSSTGEGIDAGRLASRRSATSDPGSSFEPPSDGDREQPPESPASQGTRRVFSANLYSRYKDAVFR